MKWSACVASWNEANALKRLVLSSLPAIDTISEWVILDHRSEDHTPAVLDEIEEILGGHGVPLVRLRESRDLSPAFTFADLRNRLFAAASSPLVLMLDADFVLGSSFRHVALDAAVKIASKRSNLVGVRFRIPVIWDELTTDANGVITSHGRVWWHSRRSRFFHEPSVTHWQNGKWEKIKRTNPRRKAWIDVPNGGSLLVSVNVKPPERLALRRTMTYYMEDALAGKVEGSWLEAYERGGLREMPPYPFDDAADLRGVQLHAPGLRLGA